MDHYFKYFYNKTSFSFQIIQEVKNLKNIFCNKIRFAYLFVVKQGSQTLRATILHV